MNRKKRIGVYIYGPKDWYAGVSFLKAITKSAKNNFPKELSFYLVLDEENDETKIAFLDIVDKVIVLNSHKKTLFEKICSKVMQKDYRMEKILRSFGIDYIFSCNLSLDFRRIKLLTWLPDFQHKYYPEYFTPGEVAERDSLIKKAVKKAHKIIVMSKSVRDDCKKFLSLS